MTFFDIDNRLDEALFHAQRAAMKLPMMSLPIDVSLSEGWFAHRSAACHSGLRKSAFAAPRLRRDSLRVACRAVAHATAFNSRERRLVDQTGVEPVTS